MTSRRKQILLLWEGAAWHDLHPLIDAGLMPHFSRLATEGMMGELTGVQPYSPAAGATTLATGLLPADHGIFGNFGLTAEHSFEESSSSHWRPFWSELASRGDSIQSIAWPLTHPANSHPWPTISDRFVWPSDHRQYRFTTPPDSIQVPDHLAAPIKEGRMIATEFDLNVLREFYELDEEQYLPNPDRLNLIRQCLAANYSCHAAAMTLLGDAQPDFAAISHPGLGMLLRRIQKNKVPSFELKKLYQLQDQLLGVLLSALEENTIVHLVSSLSYLSSSDGTLTPEAKGIWLVNGPGIRRDGLIHGARTIDVAPTILHLRREIPPPEMPGTIIQSLLESPLPSSPRQAHPLQSSPQIPAPKLPWSHLLRDGRERTLITRSMPNDPGQSSDLLKELQAGKYRALRERGRADEARELAKALHRLDPLDPILIRIYGAELRDHQDWPRLENLIKTTRQSKVAEALEVDLQLLECAQLLATDQTEHLQNILKTLIARNDLTPEQQLKTADYYRGLRDYPSALKVYETILQGSPDRAMVWLMLGITLIQTKDYPKCEEAMRHLIDLNPSLEKAQLLLAKSLYEQDRRDEAAQVIEQYHQLTGGTRNTRRIYRLRDPA